MSTEDLPSPTSPTSPTSLSDKPAPVLAVVIGINQYKCSEYENLEGAVADADAFEEFLKQQLKVPKSNIRSLRNEQASRTAIIDSFYWLRDNVTYKKNEPAIIFYFAGHGAQTSKPRGWEDWVTTTGQIEMLCSSDIGVLCTSSNPGEEPEDVVQGIPDRTISMLLNHISDIKGNNLCLILDCCSSGGINRGNSEYTMRRIAEPPKLKPTSDQSIWSREVRGGGIAAGFSGKFHASHVLLAACGRDQFAFESPRERRGIFTLSLMKVLQSEEFYTLTYVSLMHKIRMPPNQTPHCEGQGVNRRLFNNPGSGSAGYYLPTKRVRDGPITLHAGAAQGIVVGSRFSVHKTNLMETLHIPNPILGYLVATSVDGFTSTLDLPKGAEPFLLPFHFYCKLVESDAYRISLFSSDMPWLESVFPPELHNLLCVKIVDDVEKCDLQMTLQDGRVYFDRHSNLVTPIIGSRIRHTVPVNDVETIRRVAKATAHFYYHLTRESPEDFGKDVWMELKELKEDPSDRYLLNFSPMGPNLIAEEPATIVVNENARLGMTMFNQTELKLYPFLLYFDPTDLTIIDWYTPAFGAGAGSMTTHVDAALPPRSRLTIGYGDGGSSPWQFLLPEGDKKDLGFFKLFLSTHPTYFDSLIQEAIPFTSHATRGGKPKAPEVPEVLKWASIVSTTIQVEK